MSTFGAPRRRAGRPGHRLGEELLIEPEPGRSAIALAADGRAVWELCDGSRTVFEISRELAGKALTGPPAEIFRRVEEIVLRLVDEGAVELVESATRDRRVEASDGAAPDDPTQGGVLRFAFADLCVEVRSRRPEIRDGLAYRLRHLLVPDEAAAVPAARFSIQRDGDAYLLERDGTPLRLDTGLAMALRHLEGEIVRHWMRARPEWIWLHAGGAVIDDRAVLLVGPGGSGKSTLVTALVERGWSYLSDEVVPIDPMTGRALPFPRTPVVREERGERLDAAEVRDLCRREAPLAEQHLHRESAPIGAIVFPSCDPASPTRLLPISPARAALELLRGCLSYGHQGPAAVEGLVELVRRTALFRLSFAGGRRGAEHLDRAREHWYLEDPS